MAKSMPKNLNSKPKSPTPVRVPVDLREALLKNKTATAAFEGLSPSHRREYIKCIEKAKRAETRQKRVQITLERLADQNSQS